VPTATPYFNPHGPTPGALQGDDYPLEYYEDGYPKLPARLDRRRAPNGAPTISESAEIGLSKETGAPNGAAQQEAA
jgi:hypothetical protein